MAGRSHAAMSYAGKLSTLLCAGRVRSQACADHRSCIELFDDSRWRLFGCRGPDRPGQRRKSLCGRYDDVDELPHFPRCHPEDGRRRFLRPDYTYPFPGTWVQVLETKNRSNRGFCRQRRSRQGPSGACENLFVAKFTNDGGTLLFSTYLGGSGSDQANAIAADAAGNAYVAGAASSPDFPRKYAFQYAFGACPGATSNCGNEDAFVAKIALQGTGPVIALVAVTDAAAYRTV